MLLREWLCAGQIAISLVLLASAGMLLRSLWKIESIPLGLEAEHVITADFVLGRQGYSDEKRQIQFFNNLEERLNKLPGVTASVITDSLPPSGGTRGRLLASMQVEGEPPFCERHGRLDPVALCEARLFLRLGNSYAARTPIYRRGPRPVPAL